MTETINPPSNSSTPTEVQPAINESSTLSQEIKKFPTYDEVLGITRKIAQEESSKVKDSLATNSVTVLGIFASFIAFLTIEVQILKTVCDYLRILGFSIFILGAVLLFVTFIIYFTDSQNKKTKQLVILSSVSLLLVIGGIVFVAKGEDEYICKLNRLDHDFQSLQQKLQLENENWIQEKTKEIEKLKALLKT